MSFLCLGRFPAEAQGECCPKIDLACISLSLEDAMYVWWKIYKVRYTYNWNFIYNDPGGCSINVSGVGSVLMNGGIKYMSDKVCPQEITYTCKQSVHYFSSCVPFGEPPINEDVEDDVFLTISSDFKQNTSNPEIWYPAISLYIYAGRYPLSDYLFWNDVCYDNQYGGVIDFFDLSLGSLGGTQGDDQLSYNVSIQLSVEEESVAA